ncbi:MAG: 4Fe-4S dicluster domain-containing protein [Bacteroidota bacterium]|nr:4Fe-4S dicluster domain-containing protein [Bacteroidota bacterium]
MNYLSQILFLILVVVTTIILIRRIRHIKKLISLGRDIDRSDNPGERWKMTFLVAFGQKKMFKRIVPAILHLILYVGFIVINFEVLEFVIDGLFGTHRAFAPYMANFYVFPMNVFEFLAVLVIIASTIFLIRRNVLKVKRFKAREITAWPALDANLILSIEIVLMFAILTMNATDQVLQTRIETYPETGRIFFSSLMIPLFEGLNTTTLVILERFAWWFHIIGIMAFSIYITYSKHIHIFLAFPNTYFANLHPRGKMENMPEVTREVNMMLGINATDETNSTEEPPAEVGRLGAKDINDLHWKNLMDAFTCTECGRCTDRCPANITGKLLSPRKIMMDTRDRMEEVGRNMEKGGNGLDDGKSLLGDYILKEEINACTTCNACVEACPVMIDPLSIILQVRRYMAMEESSSPPPWNSMYSNIETNFAPWKFSPSDRLNWAEELKNEKK